MHELLSPKKLALVAMLAAGVAMGAGTAMAQEPAASPAPAPGFEEVRKEIWAKEQSIYAGRAKGSMAALEAVKSPYYRPFPTGWAAPTPDPVKGAGEKVELTYVNMAYNGGTAVIMYKSHRTRKSDGTPANEYFEITDSWSKGTGKWLLLSTRPQPVPSPGR